MVAILEQGVLQKLMCLCFLQNGIRQFRGDIKSNRLSFEQTDGFLVRKILYPSKQEATGDSKGISGVILSGWNVLGQIWDLSLMIEEYGK